MNRGLSTCMCLYLIANLSLLHLTYSTYFNMASFVALRDPVTIVVTDFTYPDKLTYVICIPLLLGWVYTALFLDRI